MRRFRAFSSSSRVIVPLPSESNSAKNLSAKNDCQSNDERKELVLFSLQMHGSWDKNTYIIAEPIRAIWAKVKWHQYLFIPLTIPYIHELHCVLSSVGDKQLGWGQVNTVAVWDHSILVCFCFRSLSICTFKQSPISFAAFDWTWTETLALCYFCQQSHGDMVSLAAVQYMPMS